MKKVSLLLLLLAMVFAAGAQVVVSGDITANTTWTKNNTYLLSGFVYVTNGATLTIEAGTLIKGEKATKGALIVTRGSKLIADGTAAEPIVFTSAEASPSYGDWGGIILLGYASTNQVYNGTAGLGLIEGGIDAVKGLYGGGDQPGGAKDNDNSGILRYVRVEYPGIAFQPNNEINGVTFGAVGSGTTVDNVQVSYSGDDSFEWFGGTVNCKHLIAYRGLDDDFDTDNGYSGKIQFALAVRDPQAADVSGSNGFESDNDASGDGATPKTKATFSNITVVGPSGANINANFKRAAHIRRNSEQAIFNTVEVGNYPVGLFIDGDSTANNAAANRTIVRNSFFNGMATPLSTNATTGFNIATWASDKSIVASTNSADAQLVDPFNLNLPNPRPAPGSPVLTAASFTSDPRIQDPFFTPVSYAGAFGTSGDWTCPWAKWTDPGCIPPPQPKEVTISTDITTNTTWTADNIYTLQGFIYVTNCATLTIQPGTVIKGDKGSKGALIVTRCAKIIADGTADKPIVFTTNDPNPTYGSWGGLILLGYASTNQVYNGTPGLGLIEGGIDAVKGLYGGGDQPGGAKDNDNSGVLRYVRVEYPGIAFQPNNEINGVTFGAVGNGTTVDNVQVSYSGDDSFEWFGGTVNCKHLIAYRGLDDDFDTDNGYSGNIQFALAVRDPQVADVSGSNGFESDNDATGDGATPKTKATFSNITVVGPTGANVNANFKRAAHLRRNTEQAVFNTVEVGNYPVGLLIDGDSAANNATAGRLIVRNTFFNGMTTPLSTNATNGFNITTWAADKNIVTSTNSADAKLVDPFNLNLPNPRPAPGSPVLTAASFTSDPRIQNNFFTPVSYAGAFGPTGDWTCPWANWPAGTCLPPAEPKEVTVVSDITTNTTWTADKTYTLQGFIYVTNCATLTIEPGTVIRGDKGSKGALIVTRCAKIIADGTADKPIVFTTNDPNPTYGSWGGLILLGYASTNQVYNGTAGLGLIEGGIDAVKGLYGGGDQPGGAKDNDNSGILRYVRVEYPGIAFQPNNEINGVTFGAVGSGTTVDNVQVSYSGDDSFEWFGGTVNCKHLIAYRGLDDDFDTDNGYSGKVQFALAVRDPQVADVSGSNGFESDNDASGDGATPKTKATFSNVTVVGPTGANVNANFKRAAHLRRNTEQAVFNSVEVGSYPVGLFIDGDSAANNATAGRLIVRNTFFNGMTTPLSTNATNGFNIATWAADKNITTSTNSADAQLVDPFNLDQPNPRPAPGSPVLKAASFTSDPRIQDAFFTPVSYAGAFGPTGDWSCPWAKWPAGNCLPPAQPQEVTIVSDITTNTTWTADKTYTLQGFIYVTNCATLTIEPGTIIRGDKGSKGALIVTRCAKLVADGTKDLPIVFTTNDPNPTYGSWGGLILLGYASTNQVYNGTKGLGLIEGGIDAVKGLYGSGDQPGGAKDDDNSGILRYVRVEYPGIAFQPNNEINGITFGAVGNKTVVDHVQVSYSGDDSFEWFGGTVNCKHLIAYRGLDDDFDTDNGYSGNVQYALAVRDPQVADVSGSNGFESDNDASGDGATPKTRANFSNVTIVGPTGSAINANFKRGAHIRRNSEEGIFNTLVIGEYPVGLLIDGDSTVNNAVAGRLAVKNTIFAGQTELLKTTSATFDINTWFNTAGWGNSTKTLSAASKLQDPFNLDKPNAQPTDLSPVLLAAAFTDSRINTAFFDKVTYIGAFDGANDWTCGWAKFRDLNLDCLVDTKDAEAQIGSVKLYPTVNSDHATLQFTLAQPAEVMVEVYNVSGQYFGQQVNEKAFAGVQTYTLNTANLPQGFYMVRIQAGAAVKTEKMIVVR